MTSRAGAAGVRTFLALALATLVAAAGCASVPTDGPVRFESMGTSEPGETSLPVVVAGPEKGATPREVARGFIEAMASYQAGQPVAREYLTPAGSERWQPSKVLVYDSAGPVSEPRRGRIVFDAPKVAEVGANGSWMSAASGEEIELDLKMTKVGGEWRIGQPPDALIMSAYNFRREYERYNLYFFDPDLEILVPEPVYVPIRGHLETLLVGALLRGPSPWLRPAVRSAVPEGTLLTAPSVIVDGKQATVDLDRRVLALPPSQRRFLVAQFSWTLGQVAHIDKVEVTVDRVPLGVDDTRGPAEPAAWSTYDPAVAGAARGAYALSDGRVTIVGPDRLVPVSGQLGRLQLSARSIAVSVFGERTSGQDFAPETPASTDWLAAVSEDGRRVGVYASSGEYRGLATGRDILEPSWDRTGKLWFVDRNGGRAKVRVADQDTLGTVVAPGIAGEDVRGLKVSREGARVAVLVERDGRTHLLVGRVERGDRIEVRGLRELPVPLTSMTDLAWSGLDSVVVIGAESQSPPRPTLVSVDGSRVEPLSAGPNSRSVAAAPGQPVLLGGEDGRLHAEDKTYLWSDQGEGACPAYPG